MTKRPHGAHQKVTTAAGWAARREELKLLVQEHILGTIPTDLPRLLSATAVNTTAGPNLNAMYVRLAFDANHTTVSFDVELAWPTTPAPAAGFPVFLTQVSSCSS